MHEHNNVGENSMRHRTVAATGEPRHGAGPL